MVLVMLVMMPSRVNAVMYGLSNEKSDWQSKTGGGYYINSSYYVTSTVNGYVYIAINETKNVKITNAVEGANFELVNQTRTDTGVSYLLKAKSGVTVNSKTEVLTVIADIVDPEDKECELDYSPLGLSCAQVDNHYFDDNSKEVTQEEYAVACEGGSTTPTPDTPPADVPDTPETGSVVPYIAIGGGLLGIAAVYLYSRKQNKVYKI